MLKGSQKYQVLVKEIKDLNEKIEIIKDENELRKLIKKRQELLHIKSFYSNLKAIKGIGTDDIEISNRP